MSSFISCLIVEDEPLGQDILIEYIENVPYLNLEGVASNAFEAQAFIEKSLPDLVFLDINLPQLNGISWLHTLETIKPNVIITTAHQDYAVESYDLNVIDYLVKPIKFERFIKAINRFRSRLNDGIDLNQPTPILKPTEENFIFVKDGKELIRLSYSDIEFMESMDDYVKIKTEKRTLVTYTRMNQMEAKLPGTIFIRLNRSFIINRAYIDRISGNQVTLLNGQVIKVTPTYELQFQQLIASIQTK